MTTLADRIERRIRKIPVKHGLYITPTPNTLTQLLEPELIRTIAVEAAFEAEAEVADSSSTAEKKE